MIFWNYQIIYFKVTKKWDCKHSLNLPRVRKGGAQCIKKWQSPRERITGKVFRSKNNMVEIRLGRKWGDQNKGRLKRSKKWPSPKIRESKLELFKKYWGRKLKWSKIGMPNNKGSKTTKKAQEQNLLKTLTMKLF